MSYLDVFTKTFEKSNELYELHRRPLNNRVIVKSKTNTPEFLIELMAIWRNNQVPCLIPNYYNRNMKNHCLSLLEKHEQYVSNQESLILFTTGTSNGFPKGVRLSFTNILSHLSMMNTHVSPKLFNQNDCTVSFMPWYHSYGLCEILSVIDKGSYTLPHNYMSPTRFWLDIQRIHPTVLFVVPKLLEQIRIKINNSSLYGNICAPLLRQIWFGKRIRYLVSGGSYLDPELKKFFNDRMKLHILQGYGCTEMSPMISMQTEFDVESTDVGRLLPNVWLDDNAHQQIKVNGTNRFLGYLGETLLSPVDYYDTGDVGMYKNGKLYIHGRSTDSVKLSNGKFIHLSRMETILKKMFHFDDVLSVFIDKDKLNVVVFSNKINSISKEVKRILLENDERFIADIIHVPKKFLKKEMISLKGEILRNEVQKFLSNYLKN
jgi:long-subunit acyl-CoA synthetase (AMP-forming)